MTALKMYIYISNVCKSMQVQSRRRCALEVSCATYNFKRMASRLQRATTEGRCLCTRCCWLAKDPKAPLCCIRRLRKRPPSAHHPHVLLVEALALDIGSDETVVVVGGGFSAAQAALPASRRGARKVVHVSRRPVCTRPFDVGCEWLHPQAGWGIADRGKSAANKKFRMVEFNNIPKAEQVECTKSARGGATIPARYLQELEDAASSARLERAVDTLESAEVRSDGLISLQFRSRTIVAHRVMLATGSELDATKMPLVRNVDAAQHQIAYRLYLCPFLLLRCCDLILD